MSIHGLQGKPGAGKSYNACQRAKDAVEAGRVVITNLPLKRDHPVWAKAQADGLLLLCGGTQEEVAPDATDSLAAIGLWARVFDKATAEFKRQGPAVDVPKSDGVAVAMMQGPLVIVDEAATTLGQMYRLQKERNSPHKGDFQKLVQWFQHHRHYAVDILLLYQDHSQIQMGVKPLIELFHTVVNTSDTTGFKTWTMYTTAKAYAAGKAAALETKEGTYKAEVFQLYDSHAEGAGAGEQVQIKRKGVFRPRAFYMRWQTWLLVGCLVAFPFIGVRAWDSATRLMRPKAEKVSTVAANPPKSVVVETGPLMDPDDAGVERYVGKPGDKGDSLGPVVRDLGELPPNGARLIGYGRGEYFFADGSTVDEATDFPVQGWRLLMASACKVVVGRTADDGKQELRTYLCGRGF